MTLAIWIVNPSTLDSRHTARRRMLAALGAALLLFSAPAAGDPPSSKEPPPTQAEALFREGRTLIAKHDYAAACPKLEESFRLDPGPGTQFNLARCYELAGRFASAWHAYTNVAETLRADGQPAREQVARARIGEVQARLSYVIVRFGADWPEPAQHSVRVILDGAQLVAAQLGAQIPVDVGEHAITVTAEGKRPWKTRVKVEMDAETLAVEVPQLEDETPAKAPEPPAPPPVEGTRPSTPPPVELPSSASAAGASGLGTQRFLALGVLGAGLIAGGVGAYFGGRAIELGEDAKRLGCASNGCVPPAALLADQNSHTYGDASTVSFVVCGALLATGGILWFTAPSDKSQRAVVVVPGVSPRAAIWVQGRF
jgi:hypothetical protein